MEEITILKINGTKIPAPKKCQVVIADQDINSDTDANAKLHRNRVAVKRTISNEWGPLEWDEISKILTSIKDVFFSVTYPDPQTGKFETKTMYVGNRTAPVLVLKGDGTFIWEGLSADFVEQ